MKKWLTVILILLIPMFVWATGQSDTGGATAPEEYTWLRWAWEAPEDDDSVWQQAVLDKKNIKITWAQVADINLALASGDYPDVMYGGMSWVWEQADGGYVIPISDYFDQMPNMRKLWPVADADGWWQRAVYRDCKAYGVPMKTFDQGVNMAWLYRKDIFDKHGLEFPESLDGLYQVMKELKKLYPNSVPYSNWNTFKYLSGFVSTAFGARFTTATDTRMFYLDADDKYTLKFQWDDPKMRDILNYYAKLYEEDLIEKEFATFTKEQFEARVANNETFIWYTWLSYLPIYNGMTEDGEWTPAEHLVTEIPGQTPPITKPNAYTTDALCISTKVEGDRLDTLIDFFDWTATEEGQILCTVGVEGETFEYVNGKPVIDPIVQAKLRTKYGIINNITKRWDPWYYASEAGKADLALRPAFEKYFVAPSPAEYYIDNGGISGADKEKQTEILQALADIIGPVMDKVIMGQIDFTSDAEWNKFQNDLKKVGLDELKAIQKKLIKPAETSACPNPLR